MPLYPLWITVEKRQTNGSHAAQKTQQLAIQAVRVYSVFGRTGNSEKSVKYAGNDPEEINSGK